MEAKKINRKVLMNDKLIEVERYDNRAQKIIKSKKYDKVNLKNIDASLKFYQSLFKKINNKKKLLEIGAGMGENTLALIKMNFNVCATDISSKSVEVMRNRFSKHRNFLSRIADMEKLPFKNSSFDIVCSAGSISYGDNKIVMNEIYRVLKPGGYVIILDSLNNNPIYRFNRYLHYLRGNRSLSTVKRIPNINLIDKYINKFGQGTSWFFGSITWTFPLLKILLSEKKITNFSNWVDKIFNVKKSAFKFVLMLNKKKNVK